MDNTLQAAIGLVRSDVNGMRSDFDTTATSLIEVDPYRRGAKHTPEANISAVDFSAGRGKTGVDLRWHPRKEFSNLTQPQKDELKIWFKTPEGKKTTKEQRKQNKRKSKEGHDTKYDGKSNGNWKKKKMKHAIKTKNGLKTVIAALEEEEKTNQELLPLLQLILLPLLHLHNQQLQHRLLMMGMKWLRPS